MKGRRRRKKAWFWGMRNEKRKRGEERMVKERREGRKRQVSGKEEGCENLMRKGGEKGKNGKRGNRRERGGGDKGLT